MTFLTTKNDLNNPQNSQPETTSEKPVHDETKIGDKSDDLPF